MATNVTVNAGEGSTQVTVITGEGSTSYKVEAGSRGPAGTNGTNGTNGAAGPNSVTTSTSSNLTGFIAADGTNVSGATAGATAATANTLALRDAIGGSNFAAVGASSVTSSGAISTTGSFGSISTIGGSAGISTEGNGATITTSGSSAYIQTTGGEAFIATSGVYAQIYTTGDYASITTTGDYASITTSGANAFIQSRSTFKLYNGTSTTTLSHSPTADRSIAFPNKAGTLAMIDAETHTGAHAFSSTTRPTSAGTGTPAATSLVTLTDTVDCVANPSYITVRDDFVGGGAVVNATVGDLGWYIYSAGGGTGAAIGVPAGTFPNIGVRSLTCGNASNAAYTLYLAGLNSLLTVAGWELCFVVKLAQTTDCDLIVGVTKDNSAIGIGKFGGISFGARYSSASDTNFMFYSKNTNTDFAANDANNYAITTGVAVGTTYNTFRIRSVVAGSLEMSINGGSWVAVTTSSITTTGGFYPFFYIATRTTTSKSIEVDFYSMKMQGVAR